MAGLFVGVDVGTQGAKAVIYDSRSKTVVSRGAYKYDVIKTNVPGRAEQHPSLWIEVLMLPKHRDPSPLKSDNVPLSSQNHKECILLASGLDLFQMIA